MAKGTGRRTILTPELSAKICAYIASGLTKKGAYEAVFISEASFFTWMKKGERDIEKGGDNNSIYSLFAKSVKEAEAKFKLTHIRNIKTAADKGQWQASAWMLERCYRDEYGKSSVDAKVELTGKDGGPVETKSTVQVYIPDNNRDK